MVSSVNMNIIDSCGKLREGVGASLRSFGRSRLRSFGASEGRSARQVGAARPPTLLRSFLLR